LGGSANENEDDPFTTAGWLGNVSEGTYGSKERKRWPGKKSPAISLHHMALFSILGGPGMRACVKGAREKVTSAASAERADSSRKRGVRNKEK